MTGYFLNEDVTDEELAAIKTAAAGTGTTIATWPDATTKLPGDIEIAILVVRSVSTALEDARAIAVVNAGIRIVCVIMKELETVSTLTQKYCSSKVSLMHGALGEALKGDDHIQEKHDGTPADKNPQKRYRCS